MKIAPRKREQIFPLPVALISTVSNNGVLNVAPWSNITPILRPLEEVVMASWIKRDTLDNIRDTGEFVINIPPVEMSEKVMISSKNFPADVDEFKEVGLSPRRSSMIAPPGVEGCLAWAECSFIEEIAMDRFSLIIGKVVNLEVDDRFFNDNGEMDYENAKPMSCILGAKGLEFTYPANSGKKASYSEMMLK
ncbi:flavin reductase family protein [Methanococcoides burtonii]|uniref:FMN-binding protein n=1 Tax=Methanococcoides burtonii (strain DSM 6242 / NBRC 107633 / OCM 468 / ACE-M) TaxID=259564 RepID=Q12X43_METBU|nr:flavin reductase family protein [Methanococcoides burtonii]ABE51983.1 FMN-binding protein [Methanococcoides burtonii DSM 6242]